MTRICDESIRIIEQEIRKIMDRYQAAGLAVSLINSNGDVLYGNTFGYRNAETKDPVEDTTVFGLASVTKSFTALCIMKMMEDGLLDTDDPVSRYLPEFNDHGGAIRIKHLLTHSAGFWPLHRTTIQEVLDSSGLTLEEDPADSLLLAEKGADAVISQMNRADDFIAPPGIYSSYCNDGFGLLSEIIRRHGGYASYNEYLKQKVLIPLHMNDSGCEFHRTDDSVSFLYRVENGVRTGDRDFTRSAFALHGGGAMKSTLRDMQHYLLMFLNRGKPVLGEDSMRRMIIPRIPFGSTSAYGYGLFIDPIDDQTVYHHGGSLPGVSSAILFSYDLDAAAVVLCNTSGVPVSWIGSALMRAAAGRSPLTEPQYSTMPWDEQTIQDACGTYRSLEEDESVVLASAGREITVNDGEQEYSLSMTVCGKGIIQHPYSVTDVALLRKNGTVYALQYGSRIYKKDVS